MVPYNNFRANKYSNHSVYLNDGSVEQDFGSCFHFNNKKQLYSNDCQWCTDTVNWLQFHSLVMAPDVMCCQEWPGSCGNCLGGEHSALLSALAGREQAQRVPVCHVTFSSSVNVLDYFLRDQNWLPRIGPPSIFSCTSRMLHEAEAHGKESGARFPSRWRSSEAVRQLVTQYPPQRWLCRFVRETSENNK